MIDPVRSRPRARQIKDSDLDFLAQFFERGIGNHEEFFAGTLWELKNREPPDGYPKYGYVLECDGAIVGAVGQIFTRMPPGTVPPIRCNVTTWAVEPRFRPFATLFFRKALAFPDVNYINVSARPHTRSIIEAQGFKKYSHGSFVAIPLISGLVPRGGGVQILPGDRVPHAVVEPGDCELLQDHARLGCITLWCISEGRAHPFVFQPRLFKGFFTGVQLIYCRDIGDIVRFSGPLGLYLATKRKFLIRIDANGAIPGLAGFFMPGMQPRYCKGQPPRLGDLAYTQMVLVPAFETGMARWRSQRRLQRKAGSPISSPAA